MKWRRSLNVKRREDSAIECNDWCRLTLVVPSAKCKRSTPFIIHLSGPLDDRKRDHVLSGYPGTRWTRFQSPEKPGYPVASPSPTPVFVGYPFVAGTRRVAPPRCTLPPGLSRYITSGIVKCSSDPQIQWLDDSFSVAMNG